MLINYTTLFEKCMSCIILFIILFCFTKDLRKAQFMVLVLLNENVV